MKKNRLITMSLREIKKSKKRFFSLCILSILGVSFFVGMKMSGPTMMESLDKYYDDNKMYDLKVISTLGLDDDDVKEIKKLNSSFKVVGSHTKDAIFNDGKYESVIRMQEMIDDINDYEIIKGRMPEKYNEIVVEEGIEYKTNYKIGDKIKLELEEDDKSLKTDELEIVGIVLSPEYVNNSSVSQSRGNTALGNGQVAYYSYVKKELFNMEYYTEIYVLDDDATKYITNSDEYLKEIEDDEKQINKIKDNRQNDRYEKLLNDAKDKIKKEEDKANSELDKAKKQLDQFKIELDNSKITLDNTKSSLYNAKKELDKAKIELNNGRIEIEQGYDSLNKAKEELSKAKQKLDNGKKEIEDKLKENTNNIITYDKLKDFVKKYDSASFSLSDIIKIFGDDLDIEETIRSSIVNIKIVASMYGINLEELLQKYGITEQDILDKLDVKISELIDIATIDQIKKLIFDDNFIILVKGSIPTTIDHYDDIIKYLDEYIDKNDDILKLFNGIRDIENGYIEYDKNSKLINENEEKLNNSKNEYNDGINKYNSGLNEYRTGLDKYNSGLNEYNKNLELYDKSKAEYEDNKIKVKKEIDSAKEELKKIEKAKWFIQTRENNNEYITYLSSYDSVENLSDLFPIIFFIVSIMISLLSMARMAIENRSEIGTLKALGFTNKEVRLKYFIYSLLASLIGDVLGALIGYLLIPNIIIEVFKIIHNIPVTVYSTNYMPIVIGIIISIICIVGSTLFTIDNLVREKTTTLLRPIAPPIGKKIWLEKVPYLWDKLKYSNKLTIRNIFRYKRRVLMSIFGIASCTMILLAGYGIKDSIAYVVEKQYNEINHNDALISLDGKLDSKELSIYVDNENLDFSVYAKIDQVELGNKRVSLITPDDKDEFKKALTIIDSDTKDEVTLKENTVVLTEKLASYFDLKVGDKITILENNNATYDFKITNICENYIGDYIYMSKDLYTKDIGKYNINAQYIRFNNINEEKEIITNLKKKNPHILSTISIINAKKEADTLFKSLNLIVYVLIIFSGALSFVVFYSLAYINISERQREIATLKVLGFYYQEIDLYIMKEEIIITIIGILVGLGAGTLYAYKLIDSLEINTMQYIKDIHLDSYLQTFGFMILFTFIVSIGVHYTLKKIHLIESLKSVE